MNISNSSFLHSFFFLSKCPIFFPSNSKAKSVTIANEEGRQERGGNEPEGEEEEEEEEEPLTFKQQLERQLGGKCPPPQTDNLS